MNKTHLLAAAIVLAGCPAGVYADSPAPATPDTPAATAAPANPAVTAPAPPAAQPVTLRLKFTPGKTTYYTLKTDTRGTMQMPQGLMPMNMHMTMTLHQTVKDVRAADGAATIDTGFDAMEMKMNGQTFPIPSEQLTKMKFVGTALILPTGKTLSFTLNPNLGAPSLPGMDLSKMNAMSSLGQFPDGPIKPGDAWKSAVSLGMMGAQVASDFTLTSVDTSGTAPIAVIAQTTKGTFDMSGANGATPAPPNGMKMSGTVNGTGTLRFDVNAGAVENQTSAADITLNMTLPGAAAPMKMQMKVTSTMQHTDAPAPAAPPAAPPVQ